jgi:hypothetical protein
MRARHAEADQHGTGQGELSSLRFSRRELFIGVGGLLSGVTLGFLGGGTSTSSSPISQLAPSPLPPARAGVIQFKALRVKGSQTGEGPNGWLSATINGMSHTQQVSLPAGTFETFNFDDPSSYPVYSAYLGRRLTGLVGAGAGVTVLQLHPGSSTKSALVPPQGSNKTNPLTILRFEAAALISGFTLLGTAQGHPYNGIVLYKYANPLVQNVSVHGIPAGLDTDGVSVAGEPPGETFSISTFHNTQPRFDTVELDGRDSNGAVVAASLLGNNYIDGLEVTDCYFHDTAQACSTAYECTGVFNYTRTRFENGKTGANFEQHSAGAMNFIDCTFAGNTHDLVVDSTIASCPVTITDPVLPGGRPLVVLSHTTYSYGLKSAEPNKQAHSDIQVVVDGVVRPDLLTVLRN